MTDLLDLSAIELRDAYLRRESAPTEAIAAAAERIEAVEPRLNAFTTLALDRAREEARAADAAYAGGGTPRPLEGIPLGVKDLFDTAGVRTTYGSSMFADHVPSRDAAAVARARAAGAIVVGKTATHEFGWGITNDNPHYGPSRNPWAPERISGGSSGGSAVALATREVALALGSDTGGSIRVPAAFCGVVGLKPTWGRVSAAGAIVLARSLDHAGALARTPADAALLYGAIGGRDPDDPATEDVPLEQPSWEGFSGLVVGHAGSVPSAPLAPDVERVFDQAVRLVESLGARVVPVEPPDASRVLQTFVTTQRAEALHGHRTSGRYPARSGEYGADVRGRLEAAAAVTVDDYLAAQAERQRIRSEVARLFESIDVLLTPVSAIAPPEIGADTVEHLGSPRDVRELVMSYTVLQDLAGLPTCALRAGFDDGGLPVGVQLTARPWREAIVLRAAQALFEGSPEVQDREPAAWAAGFAAVLPDA
jgi:aspartyl-tRNA(Asn)/glutamyl-tRNA(Gln) amidotransferase subunit A